MSRPGWKPVFSAIALPVGLASAGAGMLAGYLIDEEAAALDAESFSLAPVLEEADEEHREALAARDAAQDEQGHYRRLVSARGHFDAAIAELRQVLDSTDGVVQTDDIIGDAYTAQVAVILERRSPDTIDRYTQAVRGIAQQITDRVEAHHAEQERAREAERQREAEQARREAERRQQEINEQARAREEAQPRSPSPSPQPTTPRPQPSPTTPTGPATPTPTPTPSPTPTPPEGDEQ